MKDKPKATITRPPATDRGEQWHAPEDGWYTANDGHCGPVKAGEPLPSDGGWFSVAKPEAATVEAVDVDPRDNTFIAVKPEPEAVVESDPEPQPKAESKAKSKPESE